VAGRPCRMCSEGLSQQFLCQLLATRLTVRRQGSQLRRRDARGPPISRLTRRGERPTHKPLLEPLRTHATRPTSHSHRMKRPAVARATAGKVLARGCARQGQSTRRRLSSPSTKWNTSTTWSVGRTNWLSFSSSWQKWCHLRPSRPDMAWSSGDSLRPQGAQG